MFEEAQHLEFPEDTFGGDEGLENVWQLLEGDAPAIAGIRDRPVDNTTQITHTYIKSCHLISLCVRTFSIFVIKYMKRHYSKYKIISCL